MSDTCVGTVQATHDSSKPGREWDGSFTCTWKGVFASVVGDLGTGVIEGWFNTAARPEGQAWYGPFDASWTGTMATETQLSGTWVETYAGDSSKGIPELEHTGTFVLNKE